MHDQLRLATARPRGCHLYRALGREEPCAGGDCVFFRVPGVSGCAIERWDPDVEAHEGRAAWFLMRRLEGEEARSQREARCGLEQGHRHPDLASAAGTARSG